MAIEFGCPCGKSLKARDEQAGMRVRCPACGEEVVVPGAAPQVLEAIQADEERPRPARPAGGGIRPRDERAERPGGSRPDSRRVRDREDEGDGYEDEEDRRGPARTSGKAVAALVLGLLSFCASILTGIPAIIYGILSLQDIGRSKGRLRGSGLAVTGIVLGTLGMVLVGPAILIGLLVPAVQKVRESAARMQSSNNLKMMGLAMHNYHASNGKVPVHAAVNDKDGKPLLSWRVELLPYLEQEGLYRQFKRDEPWDSPHNKTLIPLMPRIYAAATADPAVAAQGMTHYRAVTGPRSAFEPRNGRPPTLVGIPDGTSNTIMIAEAADPVIWTKPDELEYRPGGPLPRFGIFPKRPFQVVMWDGSVRAVYPGVSPATLGNAMMADDGQVLGPDW